MKKPILLAAILLNIFSVRAQQKTKLKLEGSVADTVVSKVYLQKFHNKTFTTVDSAAVSNGKFKFSSAVVLPELYGLSIDTSKNVILITGRNHPPEVTGHYALQAFVETLTGNTDLAKQFRKKFLVYVVPLLNPDGVDGGFWRNNSGGIDLNRDWSEFNQPESRAVRNFLNAKIGDRKKLLFSIDFHSTWDDIYYTVDPALKGNLPGFVPEWLDKVKDGIPGYTPHVKPLYFNPPTFTLFSYLFEKFKTESLVFEIGDNTPKDFIVKKGDVSATEFMKLILARTKNKS